LEKSKAKYYLNMTGPLFTLDKERMSMYVYVPRDKVLVSEKFFVAIIIIIFLSLFHNESRYN
jgi:hypothetical protein